MMHHLFIRTLMAASCTLAATSSIAAEATSSDVRFSDYPDLTQEERSNLSLQELRNLSQNELNVIYARLSSGPQPVGQYEGTVVFDNSSDNDIERMLGMLLPEGGPAEDFLKGIGVNLWHGKFFHPETASLTNRIGPLQKFAAHVYCGQSLLDSRKESLVLDYNYAETAAGYDPLLDWTMAREGLGIRDEIRMVHPGLYLGRAYIHNVFAVNFILSKDSLQASEESWEDGCVLQ